MRMFAAMLFVTFALAGGAAAPPAPQACGLVELPGAVRDARTIMLGEIHGTEEMPRYVGNLVCALVKQGKPVTLGLEMPEDLVGDVENYLASDGGANAMTNLTASLFWTRTVQDGRSSRAMLRLIDDMRRLRSTGAPVDIAAFDIGITRVLPTQEGRRLYSQRDVVMAQKADRLRKPGGTLVLLAGNEHAPKYPGETRTPERQRMAASMDPPPDVSLLFLDRGGSYWICNPSGCGVNEMGGVDTDPSLDGSIEIKRQRGYDGVVHVGAVTASPPAVPPRPALALPAELRDARTIVLGEVHGSEQMPRLATEVVRTLLAQGKPVTLGLEMGQDLGGDVEDFLRSDGSANAIAALTSSMHWGRGSLATHAMLQLLGDMRRLRAAGKPIEVAGFDIAFTRPMKPEEIAPLMAQRDRIMAKNADALRKPDRTLVLLTGNGHAAKYPEQTKTPSREPMAALMQPPPDVSLLIAWRGGRLQGCNADGCAVQPIEPHYTDPALDGRIEMQRRAGYDGIVYVGALSPSPLVRP